RRLSHADATNDDQQVSLPIRVAYGIGSIADGAKNAAFNGFLVLYYTTVLGLPGTLSGLAIFIALCVDAITDPLVGSISDHFRSRWGRRHPFMYFAAIPMGLCFYGLFSPPDGLSEQQLFVWLTGFAIGVRLFLTFYMVPSGALGPEMTTHYDERTRLVAYRWLIGWAGALAIASAGWFVFFADREVVGDGRLDPANYSQLGIFAGVLVASAILISSAGTHSVIPRLRQPAADGPVFSFGGFARDAAAALKSHTLRMLLGSSLFSAAALGVAEVLEQPRLPGRVPDHSPADRLRHGRPGEPALGQTQGRHRARAFRHPLGPAARTVSLRRHRARERQPDAAGLHHGPRHVPDRRGDPDRHPEQLHGHGRHRRTRIRVGPAPRRHLHRRHDLHGQGRLRLRELPRRRDPRPDRLPRGPGGRRGRQRPGGDDLPARAHRGPWPRRLLSLLALVHHAHAAQS
ncbi:MAG: MFS transporter, partial [Deltaproteobacteria bacterium]|nr:MFS transporter [Deltaproteobacteria bacterium]